MHLLAKSHVMFSDFILKKAYLPYHVVICVCYQEKGAAFIMLLYSVKFLFNSSVHMSFVRTEVHIFCIYL